MFGMIIIKEAYMFGQCNKEQCHQPSRRDVPWRAGMLPKQNTTTSHTV